MRLLTIPSTSRALCLAVAAAVLLTGMFALAGTASAANESVTIYQNKLRTEAQRAEILKRGGGKCVRRPSESAVRFRIGKATRSCAYLVPVIGRDIELSATGRIFKSTPKAVKPKIYLALNLRQSGNGSRYELAVYPSGRRYQIRKHLPDGRVKILKGGKAGRKINGFGEPNRMTFQVYNGVVEGKPKYMARISARVNGKSLAVVRDPRGGGDVPGQDTTFAISSTKGAKGALGSFTNLKVRIPNPF
jgi:hypothetical protein